MKKEKKFDFFSQLFIFIMKLVLKFFINNLLINALQVFPNKIPNKNKEVDIPNLGFCESEFI